MKRSIIVSIFPTYLCNQNCDFCYLSTRHSSVILDLDLLEIKLAEITSRYDILKFNLYGGEITLLPRSYLQRLNGIMERYNVTNYLTSNLYDISKLDIFNSSFLSTSLNVERPDYTYIKKILADKLLNRSISVLSMITPSIINTSPAEVLSAYNGLNIAYVSFIKYYPSVYTGDVFNISQATYEYTLKCLLSEYISNRKQYDFGLGLEEGLTWCINRKYPVATNDQCIRISPEGKFGAIYYDENNLEDFVWYDTLDEYEEDCNKEKSLYLNKCGFCEYYRNCWTEHITREPCDGCKNLLNWWKTVLKTAGSI